MQTWSHPVSTAQEQSLLQGDTRASGSKRTQTRNRQVAIGLVAVLISLIALEGMARIIVTATRPSQYGGPEADCKFQVARQATQPPVPSLLLLGTSYVSRGLYSELLAERLRQHGIALNVRNLAYSGNFPLGQVDILDTAVKYGARPRAVILDVTPFYLNLNVDVETERNQSFLQSFAGRFILPQPKGTLERIARFAERNSYLLLYRDYLRTLFTSIPEHVFSSQRYLHGPISSLMQSETSAGGWSPAFAVHDEAELARSAHGRMEYWQSVYPFPRVHDGHLNCRIWEPLKQYCDKRSIPIILIWMPEYSAAARDFYRQLHLTEREAESAFENLSRRDGLFFIDLHDDQETTHYQNFDHLNASGAVCTTERLATILTSPTYKDILEGKGRR